MLIVRSRSLEYIPVSAFQTLNHSLPLYCCTEDSPLIRNDLFAETDITERWSKDPGWGRLSAKKVLAVIGPRLQSSHIDVSEKEQPSRLPDWSMKNFGESVCEGHPGHLIWGVCWRWDLWITGHYWSCVVICMMAYMVNYMKRSKGLSFTVVSSRCESSD